MVKWKLNVVFFVYCSYKSYDNWNQRKEKMDENKIIEYKWIGKTTM